MAFNVPINLKEYHQDTSAKNHFKRKKKSPLKGVSVTIKNYQNSIERRLNKACGNSIFVQGTQYIHRRNHTNHLIILCNKNAVNMFIQ